MILTQLSLDTRQLKTSARALQFNPEIKHRIAAEILKQNSLLRPVCRRRTDTIDIVVSLDVRESRMYKIQ